MQVYKEVKEMLCDELEKIAQKGELTAGTLDVVDKITHSIKSIETIEAMEDYEDGHSEAYYDGRYYPRYTYRRGRDDMGRYTSRGRYSRAEAHEEIVKELHEIMDGATDESVKAEIRKAVKKIEEL